MSEPHPSHEWEIYAGRTQCRRCGALQGVHNVASRCHGAASAEYPSSSYEAEWQHKNRRFKAACAALTGLLASEAHNAEDSGYQGYPELAQQAICIADALLEALKEKS